MSGSVRDRVSEDLQKARSEGGLRADRIKAIVKAAVSQAIAELKEGSGEIGTIARDAISAVADDVKGKGQDAAESLRASVEGAVEGISEKRKQAIAQTQAQVDVLQGEIIEQEQRLQSDIEGALVKIEETGNENDKTHLQAVIASVIANLRDTEAFASMQEQYGKLKAQLAILDANLAARYGERYEDVRKHLDTARVWYDDSKNQMEQSGHAPGHQQKVEFEQKLSDLGTALAHKEKQIKEKLKDLWLTSKKL